MGGTWENSALWAIKYNMDCRMWRMENEERTYQKNDSMESRRGE